MRVAGTSVMGYTKDAAEKVQVSNYDFAQVLNEKKERSIHNHSKGNLKDDYVRTELPILPNYNRAALCDELEESAKEDAGKDSLEQDANTQSDVIVKPDGSRVLVITMQVGGMEATTSIELSKPTDAVSDSNKEEGDTSFVTNNRDKTEGAASMASTFESQLIQNAD